MSSKQLLSCIPLAFFLALVGCMNMPEVLVCSNGLICPADMYCAAVQNICIAGRCGDGTTDGETEMCDDGDLIAGDGCSPECRLEIPCGNDAASAIDVADCRMYGKLALGRYHTCALSNGGAVHCWGQGTNGQLGYGSTNNVGDDELPSEVGNAVFRGPVLQLAAGYRYTCALFDNGDVRCWGQGSDGQLGYGDTNDIGDVRLLGSAVDIGSAAIQIAAGYHHTCALLDTGDVRCWGRGSDGQLGYGNTDAIGDDETPASAGNVDVGSTVIQLAAGAYHTCALLSAGTVRCWGAGQRGQLGYGNIDAIGDDETPASAGNVDVGGTVIQLAAGAYHTCALLDGGAVRCWGRGDRGQLGYGNTDNIGDNDVPASVSGTLFQATQVTAGAYHTCALLDDGSVRCWGLGSDGQLGYGNTDALGDDEQAASIGSVDIGGTVIQLAAGAYHTCAMLDDGAVRCWGSGGDGQLGYGNRNAIGDDETPSSAGNVSYE